jgi:hypothetical protein
MPLVLQVMRIVCAWALRAVCACDMHMACVCTTYAVCVCGWGGGVLYLYIIGTVCVRECGPVRVSGTSDRGPTQATLNPPATAH